MKRREFIALLGSAAAAWPLAAHAQQPERLRRIGVLAPYAFDEPDYTKRLSAFRQELERRGWSEGRNVHITIAPRGAAAIDIRRWLRNWLDCSPM